MDGRPETVLAVRVELVDSEPEIWRQLEVVGSLTLPRSTRFFKLSLVWEGMHLHRFTAGVTGSSRLMVNRVPCLES